MQMIGWFRKSLEIYLLLVSTKMAAHIPRTFQRLLSRRLPLHKTVRAASDATDVQKKPRLTAKELSELSEEEYIAYRVERHAVKKYEVLPEGVGYDDPFHEKRAEITRLSGTFNRPIVVTTINNQRPVGCVCEDCQEYITWMVMTVGEKRRCSCGFWFYLQKIEFD